MKGHRETYEVMGMPFLYCDGLTGAHISPNSSRCVLSTYIVYCISIIPQLSWGGGKRFRRH